VTDSVDTPRTFVGEGAYVWDGSGRKHIDWICGYGPVVLGHADRRVADAANAQLRRGSLLPFETPLRTDLERRLLERYPWHDEVALVKTGSEAVAASLRIARAATGRSPVLRYGFHGWHDGLIDGKVGWHNWDNVRTTASPVAGVAAANAQDYSSASEASAAAIASRIAGSPRAFAALVVDPIQLVDVDADMALLRSACDASGTCFVLDETKTAFRTAHGGVCELSGVRPDVTVAGKALANGLPLSAVLSGGNFRIAKSMRIKGTFSGELVAIAAAIATLDALNEDDVPARLEAIGTELIDGLNKTFENSELLRGCLSAERYRWPCMPHIHASTRDRDSVELRSRLIDLVGRNGVQMLDGHNSFVSAAHTSADVDRTIDAFEEAIEELENGDSQWQSSS
jgi:glutamate-1-semialdehyde 2,1-aminomutase